MAEDLQIYEDTIRRLLENKGILEPDIADYDASRMRSYYFKKQQYQQVIKVTLVFYHIYQKAYQL